MSVWVKSTILALLTLLVAPARAEDGKDCHLKLLGSIYLTLSDDGVRVPVTLNGKPGFMVLDTSSVDRLPTVRSAIRGQRSAWLCSTPSRSARPTSARGLSRLCRCLRHSTGQPVQFLRSGFSASMLWLIWILSWIWPMQNSICSRRSTVPGT